MTSPLKKLQDTWNRFAFKAVTDGPIESRRVTKEMQNMGWSFKEIFDDGPFVVAPDNVISITHTEIRNPQGKIVKNNDPTYLQARRDAAEKVFPHNRRKDNSSPKL